MVGGFEIPLDQPEVYGRALERSRRILDSLELETFSVTTNFRSFGVDWTPTYGSALASCLMIFQERFSIGMIAQGLSYDFYLLDFPPEGSNAITEHLMSSERFRVVADGAGYHRADKIEVIGEWPAIRENLRVCWAGAQKDRNCCKCEKCVRNILIFRMLGLGLPPRSSTTWRSRTSTAWYR